MLIVKAVPSFIEQLLYAKTILSNSSNKHHEVCTIIIPILHINKDLERVASPKPHHSLLTKQEPEPRQYSLGAHSVNYYPTLLPH